MKILMSLSASDRLFYFTQLPALKKIVAGGKLLLSPTGTTTSDAAHGTKYPYFMSLTRSRQGSYHARDESGVLLEYDGRVLGQRNAIRPVDYWNTIESARKRKSSNEMEERLYSRTKDLDVYAGLLSVSVLIDNDGIDRTLRLQLATECSKRKIPLFFYTDRKAWLLGNRRKAVGATDTKAAEARKPYVARSEFEKNQRSELTDMRVLLETLLKNPDFNLYTDLYDLKGFSDRTRGMVLRYQRDLKPALLAEFQNAGRAQNGGNPKMRKRLDALLAVMKKFNLSSAEQLADFITQRHQADWQRDRDSRPKDESDNW